MLIDKIIEESKNQKVNVFFDMDGTLVEFDCDVDRLRYTRGSNFFINKRPLTHVIANVKRLFDSPNIAVHILSNCPLKEQVKHKVDWVKQYLPFIKKENIHIICYENLTFTKEEKPYLKGKFIKNLITNGEKSYLIDDDSKNIICANTFDGVEAYHATTFVD